MSKPKVFVCRDIPEQGLIIVQNYCKADVWPGEIPPSREELIAHIRDVDGLLCLLTDLIDQEVIEAAGPQLKVISNHAVGFDNVDVKSATRLGIPVGNTPGILTETTADFTFALIMATSRRLIEGHTCVRSGGWRTWGPKFLLGKDIFGATIGIVGYGRIGQAVARRARGFNMKILYYDPDLTGNSDPASLGAQATSLEELLRKSDFVTIHTPLNEQTYHMLDKKAFQKMKPDTILINTARGGIVESEALYIALKEHSIAFAALDVTEPEPIPIESPLLELDNLLITPHMASASQATRGKMAEMAACNLIAGLRGERLPYCVNPEVYDTNHFKV